MSIKNTKDKLIEHQLDNDVYSIQNIENLSKDEVFALIENLKIHQYEIESQNEELKRLKNELEIAKNETESQRKKFYELYKYSPTAFFTFDDNFKIIDCNLKALELMQVEDSNLIGRSIHQLVLPEFQNIFHKFCFEILNTQENHECEIKIINLKNQILDVRFSGRSFSEFGDNSIFSFAQVFYETPQSVIINEKVLAIEKNFETFFENLPIGAYRTNIDGKVLNANKAFIELFGYKNIEELNCDFEINKIVEKLPFRKHFNEIQLNSTAIIGYEYEIFNNLNKKIYLRENCRIIRNSNGESEILEGTVEDITQIKITEKTLQSQQNFIRKVIETLPDFIYVYELQSKKVTFANSRCNDIFGLTLEDVMSSNLDTIMGLIHPEDLKKLQPIYEQIEIGNFPELFKEEYRIRNKKGEYIWVSETANSLIKDNENKVVSIIGSIKEISNRKSTELKLADINKQKDKFFSIIAHDMRGPFMGFIGLSEILSRDYNNLSITEIVEISSSLFQSAQRIHRLLENLLEWAKIQQGDYFIDMQNLNLFEAVNECVELAEHQLKQKRISLNLKIDKYIIVNSDNNFLQTIIRNILSNAIKFTKPNGTINVSYFRAFDKIYLDIQDNGVGMTESYLENIFDLTVKTSTFGTNNELGSGLGLILCKDLASKNGGDLFIESSPEIGTKVRISINCAK